MIIAGALRLVPVDDEVTLEIAADDWPARFPWLGEPKEQRVNAELGGEPAYGQVTWIGAPLVDGRVVVDVTASGNRAPRFRWSDDGGETWDPGNAAKLVPLGGSVPLGSSGLTAAFAASPTPETGTIYTFSGPGVADQEGVGPELTISGSGSIDGVIEIQTGVGSFRWSVDGGAWSAPISMSSTPVAIAALGIVLGLPDDDFLGLEILEGSRFSMRARGYFTARLRRGSVVETYERLRVGDPLFLAAPGVPPERRSKLVTSAVWVGEERPPVGIYGSI